MTRKLELAASLLTAAALASIAATSVAAGNPQTTYTCTKTKNNGDSDVRVAVPETAVAGLTNAGYTCVVDTSAGEGDQGEDETPGGGTGADSPTANDDSATGDRWFSAQTPEPPEESRSLYCSTTGPLDRGSAEGAGVALNLFDSQGASLVEKGLVTPARFYEGLGVSCDVLPGFTYTGVWVDHVGDVTPGSAVYPYFVLATT